MSHSKRPEGVNKQEARLISRLHHGKVGARVTALSELRAKMGTRAAGLLCAALQDPHVRVRIAAATELGILRDPNTIQPLIQALRASRSPQSRFGFHLVDGLEKLCWLIAVGLLFFRYWRLAAMAGGTAFVLRFIFRPMVEGFWWSEHDGGTLQAAIANALAEIAEHRPSPAAAAAVAELRSLCATELSEIAKPRDLCREAADRIEAATADYRQLPLAAEAPKSHEDALPLPAQKPDFEAETLPRVHE